MKSFVIAAVMALTIMGGVGLTSNAPTFDDVDAVAVPAGAEMLATHVALETVHRTNHQSRIGVWEVSGRTGPDGILTHEHLTITKHGTKLQRYLRQFTDGAITEKEFQGYIVDLDALTELDELKIRSIIAATPRTHPRRC